MVADALGPVGNYTLRDIAVRPPGPREVRIAVRAAAISFVDMLVAAGRYQAKPPLPFTPGSECAGVVEAVGAEVEAFRAGDRVIATGWVGALAERVTAPESAVSMMPTGLSFAEASAFPVSFLTAWHGLVDRGRLAGGETLLVLGAGGATGHAAVQVARLLGARVIASASSAAKRALALAGGADAAVEAGAVGWRQAVLAANGGRPVDMVFDPVGGPATEAAFRALGHGGRHLVVGFPAGIASLPADLPLLKAASVVGVNLAAFAAGRPQEARASRDRLLALAADGRLRPAIASTFPLEAFAEAMTAVVRGESAGRIVVEPG